MVVTAMIMLAMIVIIAMVMVVAVMMVMIVPVAVVMTSVGRRKVGAAFGIERRLDGGHFCAEPREQRLDRGVAPHTQPVREQLNRHMPVAEMPGEPRERGQVLRARLDERLRLGDHLDQGAVVEQQQIAHAQRDLFDEVESKARPLHAGRAAVRRPALLGREDHCIDDVFVVARSGGDDFHSTGHPDVEPP